MKTAAAIVTDRGGRTCHAAIVARELGVPAVVGTHNATGKLKNDARHRVLCRRRDRQVYDAMSRSASPALMPTRSIVRARDHSEPRNPSLPFTAMLPNTSCTGENGVHHQRAHRVHPIALVNPKKVTSPKKAHQTLVQNYARPSDFFVEKLSEGIDIAGAFYPKPVSCVFPISNQ